MNMPARKFRPSLLPTVIVVLMLGVLLSLGTWQIDRGQQKQQLIDRYQRAPSMPVMTLDDIGTDWQQSRYRRLVLKGRYDSDFQVLLENQIQGNRSGYMVLTPLYIADSDQVVLVNRGWLPRQDAQAGLPDVAVMEEIREVVGLINLPPEVGMRIGSLDDSASGWPKAVPYIDTDWISLQLGKRIMPWVVLLAADQADGYARSWEPSVRMSPEKHQGYAFQWYSLAAVLVFLFVVGSLRPQGKAPDSETEDGGKN